MDILIVGENGANSLGELVLLLLKAAYPDDPINLYSFMDTNSLRSSPNANLVYIINSSSENVNPEFKSAMDLVIEVPNETLATCASVVHFADLSTELLLNKEKK